MIKWVFIVSSCKYWIITFQQNNKCLKLMRKISFATIIFVSLYERSSVDSFDHWKLIKVSVTHHTWIDMKAYCSWFPRMKQSLILSLLERRTLLIEAKPLTFDNNDVSAPMASKLVMRCKKTVPTLTWYLKQYEGSVKLWMNVA